MNESVITTAYQARKLGHIRFSANVLRDNPLLLEKVYARLLPIEIKHDFVSDSFQVLGAHDDFEPVPVGGVIPTYRAVVHTKPKTFARLAPFADRGANSYTITYEKLEDTYELRNWII